MIEDERYYVTEEAIQDSFFLILREKDMEKITVADIVKKAGIVRSTFYNHYENIPALVTAIEDRTINDIFALMETFRAKSDRDMCKSYFLAICRYTMTNPFLAGILRSPRGDSFFEKCITMFHHYVTGIMQSESNTSRNQDEYSYLIACSIGSTLGVLHKWSVENFRIPPDVIAEILTRVFVTGVLPFMS